MRFSVGWSDSLEIIPSSYLKYSLIQKVPLQLLGSLLIAKAHECHLRYASSGLFVRYSLSLHPSIHRFYSYFNRATFQRLHSYPSSLLSPQYCFRILYCGAEARWLAVVPLSRPVTLIE